MDAANPDPLNYMRRRGVNPATAVHHMLGYALDDPQSLVRYLTEYAPELMPYAQEAGLLVIDRQGHLRTHWNLCGALIFPTIAEGEITDLRARKLSAGAKTRSLAGSPHERGAIYPFGWDDIDDADTVMLTESGEFKTLVPLAAYQAGDLSIPTIGCPGINGLPPTLGMALAAKGVRCVIIAYDSQPRPVRDGSIQLAPEELWTLKHGRLLADAGCCGCHSAAPIWSNHSPRSTWMTFVFGTARIASNGTLMMPRCSPTITRASHDPCAMLPAFHHPRPIPPGARARNASLPQPQQPHPPSD